MFFQNLDFLCQQNHTTITAVSQSLGLSKGSVTSWKNGAIPNGETLLKFANYFNVSTDYLLTGKEKYKDLNSSEEHWLDLYKQLSCCSLDIQNECIGFVKGYIARGTVDIK